MFYFDNFNFHFWLQTKIFEHHEKEKVGNDLSICVLNLEFVSEKIKTKGNKFS